MHVHRCSAELRNDVEKGESNANYNNVNGADDQRSDAGGYGLFESVCAGQLGEYYGSGSEGDDEALTGGRFATGDVGGCEREVGPDAAHSARHCAHRTVAKRGGQYGKNRPEDPTQL